MRQVFLVVALFFLFALTWLGGPAFAQGPTPAPTPAPSPSPTPSLLPPAVSQASDWFSGLVQTYGWVMAILAVVLLLVVATLAWFGRSVAGGVSDTIKDEAKQRTRVKLQQTKEDDRLKEYLENFQSAYSSLDLKSLDERGGYDADVRLRAVYIPLRARGSLTNEEKGQPTSMPGMGEREPQVPELIKWLGRAPRLVVLGRAGSGKSTFLKYVALVLAQAWLERDPAQVHKELKVTFDPLPVPVYFPLREFGVYWNETVKADEKLLLLQADALLRFLEHNFKRYGLDAAYFQKLLRRGQCLIFLDGLDEVKPDLRAAVVEVVEAFVREYASSDASHPNRYVIACRPEAYRGQAMLKQFQHVTIEPLTQEQVAGFVRRWYREVLRRGNRLTPLAEQEADEKSRTLLQAIESKPQVRDLTDTPLLLTLIAMLHHSAQLPDSRIELYQDCTRLLLDKWERSRPGEQGRQAYRDLMPPEVPTTLDDRRTLLQPAAFWLLQTGLSEAPKSDWAKEIVRRLQLPGDPTQAQKRVEVFLEWSKERCNILEEWEEGVYRFTHHRTFQEYLAAGYLVGLEDEGIKTALALAPQRDWWETLRLMVAAMPPGVRKSDFLCRALDCPEPEGALFVASCLQEGRDPYLDPALIEETRERLVPLMPNVALPVKETRALAGELLGSLGDPRPDVNAEIPVAVPVAGGEYWVGSPEENQAAESDERPRNPVRLNQFWIGRYPVTNAQYERFVQDQGYATERYWTAGGWAWRKGEYRPDLSGFQDQKLREVYRAWVEGRKVEKRGQPYFWKDRRWNIRNHPVVGVTWFEAMAYCEWLTERLRASGGQIQIWRTGDLETLGLGGTGIQARLPTEAEWEAAARGVEGKEWPWGNTFDPDLTNTSESNIEHTTAVGQYPGGASPCNAQDMAGNVWEWCQTLYLSYPYRIDHKHEQLESDGFRVLRGGSWLYNQDLARGAYRSRRFPDGFHHNVGFRVLFAPNGSGF